MPELPEVETVRRSLEPLLLERRITQVEILHDAVALPNKEVFQSLVGTVFKKIDRRGKYLLFRMSDDQTLTIHLRMTGKLIWQPHQEKRVKHTHGVFCCDMMDLRFVDVRRFGRLWLLPEEEITGLQTLGPEPIDEDFCSDCLKKALAKHPHANIKGAILNQTVVAGLGNIYADEALFAAKIHPLRQVSTLKPEEIDNLAAAMTKVLNSAICHRGTSFRDYVDARGQKGDNREHLQIFLREGMPCPCCGAPIERIKVVGRSSYYCPCCQKQ